MDTHSDIDLLVIGNHKILPLQRQINKLQKEIDREINITHMDKREFLKRKREEDPFLKTILKKKHIKVI